MNRTSVRRHRMAAAVLLVASLTMSAPVARALTTGRPTRPLSGGGRVYVVRTGDTLWTIAERAVGGGDPRSLVDAIAARNGIDAGWIVPGQTLVIPPAG